MRGIALIIALALLAVGFYRLWKEQRAPARPARPPSDPDAPSRAAASTAEAPRAPRLPSVSPPQRGQRTPLASLLDASEDDDITLVTLAPVTMGETPNPPAQPVRAAVLASAAKPKPEPTPRDAPPPPISAGDDEDEGAAVEASAVPIVVDDDAALDEPTRVSPFILVSAAAQTDRGRRRRRNEDSLLVLEPHHLFVVADGMGGHVGGDVASKLAVEVIAEAFEKNAFAGDPYPDVPRRGGELALAIQMANRAVYERARAEAAYGGMGTTIVGARFSPHKQRVYIGHVGDSRAYRLRGGQLTQLTTDHTMASEGLTGPMASHLNRAVGIRPAVKVDLIIARPRPSDVYLLCSDGLSKMVPDEQIRAVLAERTGAEDAVRVLVDQANAQGGRDNITVVVVEVKDAVEVARELRAAAS